MTDTETIAPDAGGVAEETGTADDADVLATEAEVDGEALPDEGGAGDDDGSEEIELDFGGAKHRVPKDATAADIAERVQEFAGNLWREHTKRSEAVAEQKKANTAQQEALNQLGGINEQILEGSTRARALGAQIAELQKIDLVALSRTKPELAQQASFRLQQLERDWAAAAQDVQTKVAELEGAQTAERSRRADEGRRDVVKHVPGWNDETERKVVDYAVAEGIAADEAKNWALSPIVTRWAHKAMLWDAAQSRTQKRAATGAQAQTPTEPVKPVSKARGGPATQNPDKMTTAQWMAWRTKQARASG